MTVQELIEALESCPPSAQVRLATDSEGNGFAAADEVMLSPAGPDGPVHPDDMPDDAAPGDYPEAVFIWP